MREWWARLSPAEKREKIARRDARRVREQDRRKQAKRRTAGTATQRLKIAARDEVRKAKLRGDLVPGPCEWADTLDCAGRVEAHHADYSKPLAIRWLCRRHHSMLDELRQLSDYFA